MNKIQEFNSIVECSKEINISASCISDNCRGKTQSTKCGYVFRYSS
jgi:predicted transcriptional regulator